jgi:hypothetical protein
MNMLSDNWQGISTHLYPLSRSTRRRKYDKELAKAMATINMPAAPSIMTHGRISHAYNVPPGKIILGIFFDFGRIESEDLCKNFAGNILA